MTVDKIIEALPKCKTCERIRYPEKFCVNCEFSTAWKDNYKLDQNIRNLLEAEHEKKTEEIQ